MYELLLTHSRADEEEEEALHGREEEEDPGALSLDRSDFSDGPRKFFPVRICAAAVESSQGIAYLPRRPVVVRSHTRACATRREVGPRRPGKTGRECKSVSYVRGEGGKGWNGRAAGRVGPAGRG